LLSDNANINKSTNSEANRESSQVAQSEYDLSGSASPTTIRNADADINVKPNPVMLSPGGMQRR